jgi:DNA-binding transcriptional MerR regulator
MSTDHLLAGQFGAAARLSPKALRLYAEQGLLVPATLDSATGYRYYAPDQLPRARLIARLRRLGLPLARIGPLADLPPEERMVELRGWLRAQRDLLDDRVALVEAIDRYVDDGALRAAVAARDVPAAKLLCRGREVSTHALPDLVRTSARDIRAHLRASGRPDDGPMRVHFQDLVSPDSRGVVEVTVAYEGSVEPVDDLYIRLAPAHRAAYLPVPARYEDFPLILHVYDAVEEWIDGRPGGSGAGHPYETYPGTGARFDVAYPISD